MKEILENNEDEPVFISVVMIEQFCHSPVGGGRVTMLESTIAE